MESYIWRSDSVRLAGGMQRLRWRSKDDGGYGKGEEMIQITEALNERRYECKKIVVGGCFEALGCVSAVWLASPQLRAAYEAQGPPTLHFLCPSVICTMNLRP
jgi:hypothetical protein